MGLGHVLEHGGVRPARIAALMGGHSLPEPKDFDRRRREAHVDRGTVMHQREGDGVVVAVDLDVIVDVDAGDLHSPYVKAEAGSGRSACRSIFSKSTIRLVW